MQQGQPERPGWQVRISVAVPGPDGGLVEDRVPSGGGVWVGGRWVLTCAHVVGAEPRTVMARFSFAGGEPVVATVAPGGWLAGEQGDLALLELDRDPPLSARPAPLCLARGVTGHPCAIYGYPVGHDSGVWAEPTVTGQTPDRLQLTAQDDRGHQIEKGFSGTGLFDTETGAVVGLVVTRDKGTNVLGGFAIPLQAVVAAFPQLGPWVGWRLGTDRFLRQHWRPRARGVYQDTTPGWYFTGRTALLRELAGWLEHGMPSRAVRVLTGPAGTGKSAVLAWMCALSDPQLRAEMAAARPAALRDEAAVASAGRVSAAVWARDLDADGAAGALATRLRLPVVVGASVDDVLAGIGDLETADRARLVVVVDALDEAREPREIARRLLLPLARDLSVKVLAGARPGRDRELLAALGDRAVVYWLDDPAWFDPQDVVEYAAASLRADFDPDLPSGYRADPGVCLQVAEAIAGAAGSNFLVAGLAARARADEPVIDVSTPGWRERQQFPAEVGQAFEDYLTRFGIHQRRARDLLRAAAYAEGSGLPADDLWVDIASALAAPRRYGSDDLAWLLDSAAAYLIESASEHGNPVYRIFHQGLIEHLRPVEKETRAHQAIVKVLMQAVPLGVDGPDWAHAPRYIRSQLVAHAAAGGLIDGLLEDPNYLISVDPAQLVPHLDAARSAPAQAAATVYREAAHNLAALDRSARASQLELTAHHLDYRGLAARIAEAAPDRPWQTSWYHGPRAAGHQVLTGHTGRVNAVAVGTVPDGTAVIVSGGSDGTVLVWRLADGAPVGEPVRGPGRPVDAVAVGALPDGTAVVVSCGRDGTVRVWRLADGTPVGEPLVGHGGSVNGMAVGAMPDGTPVIISGGGRDGTVRVWRLADGTPVGQPIRGHGGSVNAVAVGAMPGGTPVIISGGDGRVRVWRLADGAPVRVPLGGHVGSVDAVAVGALADGAAVIVGGRDGRVRVWRLADGTPVGQPMRGHTNWRDAVAAGVLPDGTGVIIGGSNDGRVRVWRLVDDTLIGEPLPRHASWVDAVAVGALPDGTAVIISCGGGSDGTVRVWRLADGTPIGKPLPGARTVAVGALPDSTSIIVSGGGLGDTTVHVWRLADGTPVRDPLRGHRDRVWALAVGALQDGTPVIVSGGGLGDTTVRVWRLADGTPVGEPLRGHHDGVHSVAVGALQDGTPVIVSGGGDGDVRVWRLADGTPVGEPLRSHDGSVNAVAVGTLPDGTPVIVSCGGLGDMTVRVWRLADGTQVGKPLPGIRTMAVGALPDGTAVIVSGGDDGDVRVWRLADGTPIVAPLDLSKQIRGIALYGNVIVTATGTDIAIHELTLPRITC